MTERLNFLVSKTTQTKVRIYCAKNDISISELFRDYINTLPE